MSGNTNHFYSLESVYQKYQLLSPLYKFIFNSFLLIAVWAIFFQSFRHLSFIHNFYEDITYLLTKIYLNVSKIVLEVFGYTVVVTGKVMKIKDSAGIYLDRGCLGRNLMGLFVGFLLAFPGNIKSKFWYIPLGLIFIFILNVSRITGLVLVTSKIPDTTIDHHAIYNYTVYGLIFLMWYYWITRYSVVRNSKPAKKQAISPHQAASEQK